MITRMLVACGLALVASASAAGWVAAQATATERVYVAAPMPSVPAALDRAAEVVRKRLASSSGPFTSCQVRVAGSELRVSCGASLTPEQVSVLDRTVTSPGTLAFEIVANEVSFVGKQTDLAAETKRMKEWAAKNSGQPLSSFNQLARDQGGPHESIEWVARHWDPTPGAAEPPNFAIDSALPLLRPEKLDKPAEYHDEDWSFTTADLGRTYSTTDQYGYPAVGFDLREQRHAAFGHFTKFFINRNLAIVLDGEVHSIPTINSKLPGSGLIEGKFTKADLESLLAVLQTEPLPLPLRPAAAASSR